MTYEEITKKDEAGRCLLCQEAFCSKACVKELPVSDIVRSVRFENEAGAAGKIASITDKNVCKGCSAPCMEACTRAKIDHPVDIKAVISGVRPLSGNILKTDVITDLSVEMCGVRFENPFLLSSSVVGSNYEMVAKAFEMGWAGAAFKTIGLFTPDEVSPRFAALEKENNPFIGFKNIEQISDHTLQENIDFIRRLKRDYPGKVIIASIMGRSDDEWTELARLMEEAGADIIECNFSCPQMVGKGLGSDVGTNPLLVAQYTRAAKKGTSLPVLAKMTPNITNMELPARAAVFAGADGLAAINTVKSIMNVDLYSFCSEPAVEGRSAEGGYSGKAVKPIALRFINDLCKDEELKDIPVSGMGGIETWKDAAEFLALGCRTVQITTSVMQYGYRIIEDLKEGMSCYLAECGFASVNDIIGRALENIVSADDVNRTSIEYPKFDREICVGCGRCYLSCFDGGHQAITMNEKRRHVLNPRKCAGCQLCRLVCPVHGISRGKRIIKKAGNDYV